MADLRRRELLALGLAGLGLAGCPRARAPRYRQQNALWSQSCYLRGEKPTSHERITLADVAVFADLLASHEIVNPYLFAGPYGTDGSVPAYASGAFARDALAILRERAPRARLQPWLGGLQNKQVRLQDPAWVARAVADTAALLERLGLEAVHVNFEYLLFGAAPDPAIAYPESFARFFAALRRALPRTFISTVIPSTAPDVHAWKLQHRAEEVLDFLPHVDQLAVLYYDTALHDAATYARNLDVQLDHFARWKAAARVELLVGTGTFVNEEPAVRRYRDLTIENIPAALAVLRRAVDARRDRAPVVDGIAVFCDWETEPGEWEELRAGWLGRTT
jgi:hypothetical protein